MEKQNRYNLDKGGKWQRVTSAGLSKLEYHRCNSLSRQQKSHRMIRLLILMTCDQQLIKHPNVDNGLIIK